MPSPVLFRCERKEMRARHRVNAEQHKYMYACMHLSIYMYIRIMLAGT